MMPKLKHINVQNSKIQNLEFYNFENNKREKHISTFQFLRRATQRHFEIHFLTKTYPRKTKTKTQ